MVMLVKIVYIDSDANSIDNTDDDDDDDGCHWKDCWFYFLLPIDYLNRGRLRATLDGWAERCIALESMLQLTSHAYTQQTLPIAGKVDLAAVFFLREKFAEENLFFGNR